MLAPEELEPSEFKLASVEDYELLIGAEAVERILKKAERLHDMHVVNINSTYYGGGVAELLSSLTLLMNGSGIRTGWRVIQGRPDFFSVTKKMHNALQGGDINLTDLKTQIYEEVAFENAARLHLDHDIVIVHDPQPLPLIRAMSTSASRMPIYGITWRRWSSATTPS
jgi:trehalose synthase